MPARAAYPAVHGVVAELIEVPEKLERAIDMVLGGALQNIVVERDEDAKRMIEYLRNNRFGRATFLPIGSVRPRVLDAREREVLKLPGCLGVASELIRFDDKYRGVIDNLLGRTVVAENLEAGIRIPARRALRFPSGDTRRRRHALRRLDDWRQRTIAGDELLSRGPRDSKNCANASAN